MGTAVMHDLRGLYYLLTRVHMVDRAQVKVSREGAKCDDGDVTAARGAFGLEWPEPLVTFALSCGSWSSPAVHRTLGFFYYLHIYMV
jgi:hypothetical protein